MDRKCYLFFTGYYMVMKAAEVLTNNSIPNRVIKAPAALRRSCSFAVMINAVDVAYSTILLENEEIFIERKMMAMV